MPADDVKVTHITLPLSDGPLTVPVISLPASAFSDLRTWEAIGNFGPVDLPEPGLS
ncbi:MAG TPA: hypothetical protein VEC76_16160 [Streptosporangiaceae bacterium]|nr:hypothetical protein [Streptosporangiaceae bacterium]